MGKASPQDKEAHDYIGKLETIERTRKAQIDPGWNLKVLDRYVKGTSSVPENQEDVFPGGSC